MYCLGIFVVFFDIFLRGFWHKSCCEISESERMIRMCAIWNGALKVKMSDPCDLATYGDRGDRDRESVALMEANALTFCHK